MTADATAAEQQQQQQEGSGVPPAAASSGTDPCWILVTGGCGYIGTHTIVLLLEQGCNVVVVDNLINSSEHSLDRVCQIVGLSEDDRSNRLVWHNVDLCDRPALQLVFEHSPRFEACIHFAGLKAVGESTRIPLKYYENNLGGTFHLLELLDEYQCHRLVFSSSATVYGAVDPSHMPLTEDAPVGLGITNAYGRTKHMIEDILRDYYQSKVLQQAAAANNKEGGGGEDNATATATPTDWKIVLLRYFNPVGAHPSGLIGEDPNGTPNNLMPYVAQVAVGRRPCLTVFGADYPTPDGTGVRDYLHVVDLAEGHLSALAYMRRKDMDVGIDTFNLGTGHGCSVLEMVQAMSKACGRDVPYQVGPRRPGDIAVCYACPKKAKQILGWEASRSLDDMCRDLWAWQSLNPNGFHTATTTPLGASSSGTAATDSSSSLSS